MILFLTQAIASPCATALLFHTEQPPAPRHWRSAEAEPDGEKGVENVMSGVPNHYETENFAIWWGFSQDDDEIIRLGEALELAWEVEINTLGYPIPPAAQDTKFNVYIGDTGGPSSLGAAGYYWYDDADRPMLVLNPRDLGTDKSDVTAAHEFFHAIQDGTQAYSYETGGGWYFEATAMWAEHQVRPESPLWLDFVHAAILQPELPIHTFDYPDGWSLEEYHHYGVALFIEQVAATAGSDVIRESWTTPTSAEPLQTLHALTDIDTIYTDYALRSGTFDFAEAALIADVLEREGGWSHSEAHRPSGTLTASMTVYASPPHPPHSYGANYWQISSRGTLFLEVAPATSEADFTAAVVTRRGAEHLPAQSVPLNTPSEITIGSDVDEAWLVVSTIADTERAPTYPYGVRLTTSLPEPAPETPSACGCLHQQPPAGWLSAMLGLLVLRVRSRG